MVEAMGQSRKAGAGLDGSLDGELLERFVLFQQDSLSAVLLPPSRFNSIETSLGQLRGAAFQQVSPFAPVDRDLDGRDPHYWHLLICEQSSGKLLGAQRLSFSLWQQGDWGSQHSYLEHTYPGLAQSFAADQLTYLEVGRVFVAPHARLDPRVLPSLIRAAGLLARATNHRYILGLMSFRYVSQQSWADWLFLDRIQRPPYNQSLPIPAGRHPLAFPPGIPKPPLQDEGSSDLEALARQIRGLEAEQAPPPGNTFKLPGLIRIYSRFTQARVAGLTVARDFNQVVEILIGTDLQSASQGSRHPGLEIPYREPWRLG